MNTKIGKWFAWVILLVVLVLVCMGIGICAGAVKIPLRDVISFFLNSDHSRVSSSILFNIRLPRVILGFAVGSALSLAGVMLQGMFRNPLVEPYTLGISGGAALGVCLNIAFGINRRLGIISVPWFGFAGAALIVLLVYFLSARKGVLKMQGLLLAGVMLSFICSSLFMLIMSVMRVEDLRGIIFWTMGCLEQPSWLLIKIMVVVSFAGLIAAYWFWRPLNAFALGQEEAQHLGINTRLARKLIFLLTSLLTGASVAIAGVIGFVGLVIPHFMRILVGNDHRILMISSFLAGGAFLIISDALARTIISPLELPVGVITGIIGGTVFIYALNRKGKS